MESLKFAIDEVWLDREDNPFLITSITNESWPVKALSLVNDTKASYSPLGYDIGAGVESSLDLVTYMGRKDDLPEYFL